MEKKIIITINGDSITYEVENMNDYEVIGCLDIMKDGVFKRMEHKEITNQTSAQGE